jgi:RimJ/RimL family protein N-acetyltransferase
MVHVEAYGVTLRRFRDDELDHLVAITSSWPTGDGIHWGTRDRETLQRKIEASGVWTDAAALDMAIEVHGELVGEIQARQPRGGLPPGVYELGIEIYGAGDRNHGLGGAAIQAMTAHLFQQEHAHRVQLSTDVDNLGMRRCAERVGFGFEGINRGFMPTGPGPHDYAMYGMTVNDFEDGVRGRWT